MNAKRIIAATVVSATVIGTAVNAFALDVYLDGNKVEFPTQPYISNNRTLVPLRPIFEKMGWNIQWDESTKQATFSGKLTQDEWSSEDVSINIDVDSPTSNVIQYTYTDPLQTYGYWYVTDVKPEIKDDTIMMPLRAISELIRKNVTWDENTQSVYIADGIPDNTYVKIPKDKVESIREACNATDDYELVAMYPLKQGDEEATAWKGRGVSVYFRNGNELRFLDYWENINDFMSIGNSEDNGLIDDYNYRCFGINPQSFTEVTVPALTNTIDYNNYIGKWIDSADSDGLHRFGITINSIDGQNANIDMYYVRGKNTTYTIDSMEFVDDHTIKAKGSYGVMDENSTPAEFEFILEENSISFRLFSEYSDGTPIKLYRKTSD